MNKHAATKASTTGLALPQNNTVITASDTNSSISTPRIPATPASTTSLDPDPDLDDSLLQPAHSVMELGEQSTSGAVEGSDTTNVEIAAPALESVAKDEGHLGSVPTVKQKKEADRKRKRAKKKKKEAKKEESSSNSESSSHDSESEDEGSSSSSSEDEKEKRKKKKKKKAAAKKKVRVNGKEKVEGKGKGKAEERKEAKKRKTRKQDSSSDDSSDGSSDSEESESESEDQKKKKQRKKTSRAKAKKKKGKKHESSCDYSSSDSSFSSCSCSDCDSDSDDEKRKKSKKKKSKKSRKAKKKVEEEPSSSSSSSEDEEDEKETTGATLSTSKEDEELETKVQTMSTGLAILKLQQQQRQAGIAPVAEDSSRSTEKKSKKGALEYKRVDQTWDAKKYDYKYTETGKENKDEFDCVFSVRRKFSWDNKFQYTALDIKSKLLRDALQIVLKGIKGVSLVEETSNLHPHMVFLYYDELKAYIKKIKTQLKKTKKKKDKKRLKQQIAHCKVLADFVDEDYEDTRKKLKSMLKAGNITYQLLWALFKPNTIAYTPTYGNKDDPRAFKVDMTYLEEDFLGNEKMVIEGRYLEYDGKIFGMGEHAMRVPSFKGPKKITNLDAYPLKYHKNPEGLKKQLIERGKKFVALQAMNYRICKGIAYSKQKRTVIKVNVNGRIMVDPAIFRRIQPNYQLSYIKQDEVSQDDSDSDSSSSSRGSDADSESSGDSGPKHLVMWKDKKGRKHFIPVPVDPNAPTQRLESIDNEDGIQHTFTEEELLIASPVVLGFSFSEKFWLEFSLQSICEIEWNKEAFESLVLQENYKQNLKGLVGSHRFNAAKTIDDVIQGKGKGLVVVLHGPPGVGKTLTAESIAEYLRCPLYAVSAGELGTNSRSLEVDLNRIMDITHSWGAILLIDEADVFMEARQAHDIHRNSLVSVFLRLLEYYQGILFLTTNRVETFDEAFRSRIHMGIKYDDLTAKARKEIWKHHIGKVVRMEGQESVLFKEEDIEHLSHKVLNGRQIKNNVATAQSIALAEKEAFSIKHIRRVTDVQEDFENDMRGGMGYRDAMRQYT